MKVKNRHHSSGTVSTLHIHSLVPRYCVVCIYPSTVSVYIIRDAGIYRCMGWRLSLYGRQEEVFMEVEFYPDSTVPQYSTNTPTIHQYRPPHHPTIHQYRPPHQPTINQYRPPPHPTIHPTYYHPVYTPPHHTLYPGLTTTDHPRHPTTTPHHYPTWLKPLEMVLLEPYHSWVRD